MSRRQLLAAGSLLGLPACIRRTASEVQAPAANQPAPGARPFKAAAGDVAVPFGSHPVDYAAGTILPTVGSVEDRDAATLATYQTWKERYLVEACDGVVVRSGTRPGNLTVSEAHGYGMMVLPLMADADPEARRLFDGMLAFFRAHPSKLTPHLMAWFQNTACKNAEGDDSATDGDVDIAYGLLLAHAQWGHQGTTDYRAAALEVIRALRRKTVEQDARWVYLGDWVTPSDRKFHRSTRTSDFITAEFRSFAAASGDEDWNLLNDALYRIVDQLQTEHAPKTGLLPDFVLDPGGKPRPPAGKLLESARDGDYGYNACRDPWRLATDYLVSGEPRARRAVERMNSYVKGATAGRPRSIRSGYGLDGQAAGAKGSLAFIAPFGVSAMVEARHQRWLNQLWEHLASAPPQGYYEDTIRLLSMLVMSGNWWAPEQVQRLG